MATTKDILDKARELGKMIAAHDAVKKYEGVLKKVQADTDAQRLITDMNRHMMAIAEKEQAGQPIEVEDKHKLQELQGQVAQNPILGEMQMVQMDYLDLMRQVDEAMAGKAPAAPAESAGGGAAPGAPGAGPIITDV